MQKKKLIKIDPKTTIHWLEEVNSTQDSFLLIADKERELTIEKCLQSPIIYHLEKEVQRKEILKGIRTAVLQTAKAFKWSDKMDLQTATLLATDLYDAFRYDTIEDILLMLRMIRLGQLGSGNGRMDHDTMFSKHVPKYLEIKSEEREKQKTTETAKYNRMEEVPTNKEALANNMKMLDHLSKKLKADRAISKPLMPIVNHHAVFISRLPAFCKEMTNRSLEIEMKKALNSNLLDAYEIYKKEIELRAKK